MRKHDKFNKTRADKCFAEKLRTTFDANSNRQEQEDSHKLLPLPRRITTRGGIRDKVNNGTEPKTNLKMASFFHLLFHLFFQLFTFTYNISKKEEMFHLYTGWPLYRYVQF